MIVTQVGRRNGPKVALTCRNCQHTFVTLRRHAKRPNRGQFCGPQCVRSYFGKARHAAQPMVGELNPSWKGGVSADHMRYRRRFLAKSPEKVAAQYLFQRAVARGEIVRASECSQCGVACLAHGHHDDYSQPLVVRWLCRLCHNRHHAAIRKVS